MDLRAPKVVLSITGIATCALLALFAWFMYQRTGNRFAQSILNEAADFQEVTGIALSDFNPKTRLAEIVWWQEYRIEKECFDRLSLLAADIRNAKDDTTDGGQLKEPTKKSKEAEFASYAAERGHSDLSPSDFAYTIAGKHKWYYTRRVGQENALSANKELIALVGLIPSRLSDQVPPTGKLTHPYAVAELREYTNWSGEAVELDLLREAALEFYPDHLIGIFPERTVEQLNQFRSDLQSVITRQGLFKILQEYDIPTWSEDNQDYLSIGGLYHHLIENGKIPPPRLINDEAHQELRRRFFAGQQDMTSMQVLAYNDGATIIAKFAEAKGLTKDDAIE